MKVTRERSFSASAGPMPRTSQSASMDPNGPAESRWAIIRDVRAGPIPGSDSMAAESARSMSTGPGEDGGSCRARFAARGGRAVVRTESMRSSWRSSATAALESAAGLLARHIRTLLPESATAARNQSALRSFEVGTPGSYIQRAVMRASFCRAKCRFDANSSTS